MLLCMLATLVAVSGFLHPPLGRLLFYYCSHISSSDSLACVRVVPQTWRCWPLPISSSFFPFSARAHRHRHTLFQISRSVWATCSWIIVTQSLKPHTSKHSWMNRAAGLISSVGALLCQATRLSSAWGVLGFYSPRSSYRLHVSLTRPDEHTRTDANIPTHTHTQTQTQQSKRRQDGAGAGGKHAWTGRGDHAVKCTDLFLFFLLFRSDMRASEILCGHALRLQALTTLSCAFALLLFLPVCFLSPVTERGCNKTSA